MPVDAKPLFRPDVLRPLLANFPLPVRVAQHHDKLEHWANLISSGQIDSFKEREILPDFLSDIFCGVLGYTGPASGSDAFTFSREKHVEVEGEFADAVLGRFSSTKMNYVVALEGKGPKNPLQRPHAGRRLSAVEQAYRYAINLPCDWIIVTNIREIRLYHKGSDQQTYEQFETVRWANHAQDPSQFQLKKLVYLLGAEHVVPAVGDCHFAELLALSERAGQEITKTFYVQFADMRQDLFAKLRRLNPQVSPAVLLPCTQKILDRVLFVAFCEDRGLLPRDSLKRAYEHADPYNPRPVWENFQGLFRAINKGNERLKIPAYNGGLFADDAKLDSLNIPDQVCAHFRDLGEYDYRVAGSVEAGQATDAANAAGSAGMVDVDLLGHIFEQSITDLERLRETVQSEQAAAATIETSDTLDKLKSKRHREGAFYTPKFITRYIVGQTLGATLRERLEALRQKHSDSIQGSAKAALIDPTAYDMDELKLKKNKVQREALIHFWESWQLELETFKIVDPACGSGAFLLEAFDQMFAQYQACTEHLNELRGERILFESDRTILEKNLYGVDLNEEAIEICRLSLWIKTAQSGKALTSLDHNIRCGNSLVSDASVHLRAFDWQNLFPEVFNHKNGGFDVVIGNPPYVRQELFSPIKPYLEKNYRSFHGMADLYVYFYELGLKLLRPGGLLSFIVSNKWLKAGYAEALRQHFAEAAWMESVVDFGHAKQIFPDADVLSCIIVARKPSDKPVPTETRVCVIPSEQLKITDLANQIQTTGFSIPRASLNSAAWEMELPDVAALLAKIRKGVSLKEYAGVKPIRGVLTGFNEAFLIDTPTKEKLVKADPKCAEIIKPYLRGQDIDRWQSLWAGLWMIFTRRGIDLEKYPSVKTHLEQYRTQLEPKPKDWKGGEWPGRKAGRYQWFEIQDSVEYWAEFAKPKIFYQVIQSHPCYALDTTGTLGNDKTFFIPTADLYLLTVLNSPLMWWHNWRHLTHMLGDALSPMGYKMETLPIAKPSDEVRAAVEKTATRLIELTQQNQTTRRDLLDWLRVEHRLEKASLKLQDAVSLEADAFVAEVKKARGKNNPLTPAALKSLREAYTELIEPARTRASEARVLEKELSDLVNAAYHLTPEEVKLMWQTKPPRMPLGN